MPHLRGHGLLEAAPGPETPTVAAPRKSEKEATSVEGADVDFTVVVDEEPLNRPRNRPRSSLSEESRAVGRTDAEGPRAGGEGPVRTWFRLTLRFRVLCGGHRRIAHAVDSPHQKVFGMSSPTFPAILAAVALTLSACSHDTTTESAEKTEHGEQASPEPGPTEDALPYMEALADRYAPQRMEESLELAHPDHPAHGYLQYQADVARADIRSGFFASIASMKLVGDNIQVCRERGGGCAAFHDFVFVDGLIADFQVNGNPLGENFFPGSTEKSHHGVSVSVSASHYSFEMDVFSVLLDVETDARTEVTVTDSWYRGKDGTGFLLDPLHGVVGQDHLAPGTSGMILLQYQQAQPLGDVGLLMRCTGDCPEELSFYLWLD